MKLSKDNNKKREIIFKFLRQKAYIKLYKKYSSNQFLSIQFALIILFIINHV